MAEVVHESSSAVSESSRSTNDSPHTEAVLIDAVKTTVKISGLSMAEADILLHSWSRCNARLANDSHEVSDNSVLVRPALVGWTQFHENLVSWVTLRAIESGRGELFMFHGAALSNPDTGATIVLAAASGTGKTTATQTLGKHLGYVTDETAAFSVDQRLYPYAKPLSLLPASNQRPKTQHSPEDLALQLHAPDPFVAAITVLDRDRTGELCMAAAEEIPLSEALKELVPQMSSLAHLARGLVGLCQQIDSLGGVVRLRYAEASDLTKIVTDLLESPRAGRPIEWSALDIGVTSNSAPGREYYRRVQVEDAVRLGGDVAVLLHEKYFLISGLGPAIWSSLADWKSATDLLNDVVALYGKPNAAEQILSDKLAALVELGLVEQG